MHHSFIKVDQGHNMP